MKKTLKIFLLALATLFMLSGCGEEKEQVIIYTTTNDDVIANMTLALQNEFPNYDIIIEYQSTSKLGAQLLAEGTNVKGDIIYDLSYENLEQLSNAELLADLSDYDTSAFLEELVVSKYYIPEVKTGGAIIVNTKVLNERGVEVPQSYEDLLKSEYKDLICMADPKATRSGYTFVKGLVNSWGEEAAFEYFDKLSENVLQYTSASSAIVNAVAQEEAAIGLGLICHAVTAINEGVQLEIVIPEEGAPYGMYGQAILKGKDERECVREVFEYLVNVYTEEHCKLFYPEQIFKDTVFGIENYPTDIQYCDMSNDTLEEKSRLLELWTEGS